MIDSINLKLSRILEISAELQQLLRDIPDNVSMPAGFYYQKSYLIPQLNALKIDTYRYLSKNLTNRQEGVTLETGSTRESPTIVFTEENVGTLDGG